MSAHAPRLVVFGVSNIISDLFDCALANGLALGKVVIDLPEELDERSLSLAERIAALGGVCAPPTVEHLDDFVPRAGERYLLGPTTPTRAALAHKLKERFGLRFCTLVHPRAYVSPLTTLGEGVFVGPGSVIGAGARLAEHVFVNRGVSIGHDTHIGAFSRVQPGSNVGGLSRIGHSVTIGIGSTLIERLVVGDHAFIGAGAVVIGDVPAKTLMVGVPAKVKKSLD
jgi:sugar O-acyltransferase (sialic acid O-acetyltransferase NeuD family)